MPKTFTSRQSNLYAFDSLERRLLLFSDLLVTEVLAANKTSITDSFGDHSPWIEIHCPQGVDVQLHDYYLTDDAANPFKWRFPEMEMNYGELLIVFASGRDLAVAGQELHTNFELDPGGGYLALCKSDGTLEYPFTTYPALSNDLSYGAYYWDNPQLFDVLSPGEVNPRTARTPDYSFEYLSNGTARVTLTSQTPGAQIRYTTNRTTPGPTSTLYSAPFTLSSTAMLTTRVYSTSSFPTYLPSPVTSQNFIRTESALATFNSNLPIVMIDTFNSAINDTYRLAAATIVEPQADGRAELRDPLAFNGKIGIRFGEPTHPDFPKANYEIKVYDEQSGPREAKMMDMPSDSDWFLYGPYSEKSLMQNYLAMKWAAEMGNYAPRVHYVELFVNTDISNMNMSPDYRGVYILMETVKIGEDRLNIIPIGPTDNAEPEISGGYLWKRDIETENDGGFGTSPNHFIPVDPSASEITTEQRTYLSNLMNEFELVLNDSNIVNDPENGYRKYIDVDSWIDTWMFIEMFKSGNGFNTYFYKNREGKIAIAPVWDYGLSMGNWPGFGEQTTGWFSDQVVAHPYLSLFVQYTSAYSMPLKIADRWDELRNTVFSTENLLGDIDALTEMLTDNTGNYPAMSTITTQPQNNPAVRNFRRWNGILGNSQIYPHYYFDPQNIYDPQGRWIEDVNLMKTWLTNRRTWIDSQFVPSPNITPGGRIVGPVTVTITSSFPGFIYYTLDGSDPRENGGPLSPAAILYTGPFVLDTTATINARQNASSSTYAGRSALAEETYILNELRITEISYNVDEGQDPNEREFIMLRNTSLQAINLEDYQFTESVEFQFPDRVIQPGAGFLVSNQVFSDGVYSGSLHDDGETIELSKGSVVVQRFTYDDDWYPLSDGQGHSIYIKNPIGDPEEWNVASGWGENPYPALVTVPPEAPKILNTSLVMQVPGPTAILQFDQEMAEDIPTLAFWAEPVSGGSWVTPSSVAIEGELVKATFPPTLRTGGYRIWLHPYVVRNAAGFPFTAEFGGSFNYVRGDVNGNGVVDFTDLLTTAQNYGLMNQTFAQGNIDFSADGLVGFSDLLLVAQTYGTTVQSRAAPTRPRFGNSVTDALLRPNDKERGVNGIVN